MPRATATQEASRLNQEIFHLPDGPAQRARDDAMRAAMAAELEGKPIPDGNPNQWADRTKNRVQFDYDAYAEVERWWTSSGQQRAEALAMGGRSSRVSWPSFPSAIYKFKLLWFILMLALSVVMARYVIKTFAVGMYPTKNFEELYMY
jgi:hypothetical protein